MTDKQIIIDGVDITNCIHRATNKLCGDINPYCRCYTGSCKDISNCNYKQLKRKEQECEELKKQWEFSVTHKMILEKDYIAELDQLKAENDELKKIIERLDVPKHEVIDMDIALENEKLKAENEELRNKLSESLMFRFISQDNEIYKLKAENEHLAEKEEEARHYLEEAEKFKNCLIEIKEIAEPRIVHGLTDMEYVNIYSKTMEQILQKISEISDGRSPVSEQMTTTVPTARSWNSVSTKKFQDSEVENDR